MINYILDPDGLFPLSRYSAPAVVPFGHVQEKRGIEGVRRTEGVFFFWALPFFFLQRRTFSLLRLFRPSKMVAEIYWQSDTRARSRRWLTI